MTKTASFDVGAQAGDFAGYALVRNSEGKPVFDSPYLMPKEVFDELSDADKEHLYGTATPKAFAITYVKIKPS